MPEFRVEYTREVEGATYITAANIEEARAKAEDEAMWGALKDTSFEDQRSCDVTRVLTDEQFELEQI